MFPIIRGSGSIIEKTRKFEVRINQTNPPKKSPQVTEKSENCVKDLTLKLISSVVVGINNEYYYTGKQGYKMKNI